MWVNSGKYKIKRKYSDIETEEILMDSKRLKESPDSERDKLENPIKERVIKLFFWIIIIALMVLFVKTFNLQISNGNYWRALAEGNRIRSYPIEPLRGIIYDKNNIPIAINIPKLDLTVIPNDLIKNKDYDAIISRILQIIGVQKDEIIKKLSDNKNLSYPIIISENIEKEKALLIESEFVNVPEIKIEKNSYREYDTASAFAHLLGYLGKVNQDEVNNGNYYLDDYIGRTGIEEVYENDLRGIYGEELAEIDNLGKTQKILATKQPINGKDIVLSIDAELQTKLYEALKNELSGLSTNRAAAVAVDPRNGKILAMVSLPSFDSSEISKGSSSYTQKIFNDKNQPLFNRVISGGYPSGSTIKPLLASAALQEKIVRPNQIINCPGQIILYNQYNKPYWTFSDWKTHGPVDMIKALAESCDVYFYTIGGGYGNVDGLGIEKIGKYLKLFGWGEKTGIDLPGEKSGLIPSPELKKQTKNETWFIGDTYNTSIGQGDITITPLQLTMAISAIANNGKLFEPQLLEQNQPKIIRDNFIDQQNLKVVQQGMRESVISGSSRILSTLPVNAAAKTGTAQTSKNKATHAWFTAFAPYENPEIVITVLIENGGEGSTVSAPVVRDVLNWYFTR